MALYILSPSSSLDATVEDYDSDGVNFCSEAVNALDCALLARQHQGHSNGYIFPS